MSLADWLVIAGFAAAFLAAWRWMPRQPSYRKIHRMERQLGYRDLTSVPARLQRKRRR